MQNETKVCFDGSTSSEETERKYALGQYDILKVKQGSCRWSQSVYSEI